MDEQMTNMPLGVLWDLVSFGHCARLPGFPFRTNLHLPHQQSSGSSMPG